MDEQEIAVFANECEMLIKVMFSEISTQHDRAFSSITRLNDILKPREWRAHSKSDWDELAKLWDDLMQLAESAAAISRIIKPTITRRRSHDAKTISKKRGEAMQYLLEIDENHSIFSRELRNRFVHLDEDIDDWWVDSKRHIITRRSMSADDGESKFAEPHEVFEHFNFKTHDLIYRGKKYNTLSIWNSILDITKRLPKAKTRLSNMVIPKFH